MTQSAQTPSSSYPHPYIQQPISTDRLYLLTTALAAALNLVGLFVLFFACYLISSVSQEIREIRKDIKNSETLIEKSNKELESHRSVMIWWEQWIREIERKSKMKKKP